MSAKSPGPADLVGVVSASPGGSIVDVWAVPGASKTELAGLHDGALRIRVTAPPDGGRANRALEKVLAAVTGADVELIRGQGSRRKRFLVKDLNPNEVAQFISRQTR